jgi:CRISPR-associated protein Cas5d
MVDTRSPTVCLRARGPLACFTRPELKVERVSYPVITPSAARGIFEAILWKPAISWHIERIYVLNKIKFIAFRRNEVNSKASIPSATTVEYGGPAPLYLADEDRTQRNTVALRDVDYIIDAHFTMTEKAGSEDNITKFVEIFERRVNKGQHFHQPYLGCREFVADILPVNGLPQPIQETRELGLMLWDIAYNKNQNTPIFFKARMDSGVLEIPENGETILSSRGKCDDFAGSLPTCEP